MEREALGCDGAGSHDATTAFATAIMVGAEVGMVRERAEAEGGM